MTEIPHEIATEFPTKAERIHLLKLSDPHFCRLFDLYDVVSRTLHRSETKIAPVDRLVERTLRKERTALKGEIADMLA